MLLKSTDFCCKISLDIIYMLYIPEQNSMKKQTRAKYKIVEHSESIVSYNFGITFFFFQWNNNSSYKPSKFRIEK